MLGAEAAIIAEHPHLLILRVDRTDPSNVVRGPRLHLFLEAHPERLAAVGCWRCSTLRGGHSRVRGYLAAIQRAARTVNVRFQRRDWYR